MNGLSVESSTGSSSVRKVEWILDVLHSWLRPIFNGILHPYSSKIQSLQKLQQGDTTMKESFVEWDLIRIKADPR